MGLLQPCNFYMGPEVFYKNYYNVYHGYCGVFNERYMSTKFRLDRLLCE